MNSFRFYCYVVLSLSSAYVLCAQEPSSRVRITQAIDARQTVTLRGNTHPLARAEFDRGAAPAELPMSRMMLLLSRSDAQQAAIEKLLQDQQTPGSAEYRHWLTPAEFGERFGPAAADVQTITAWLQQQGFRVGPISAGKNVIEFSGTAAQVQRAFQTEIHKYVLRGQQHWANASDPKIPAALAPVVSGIVSLNNFEPRRLSHRVGPFLRKPSGKVVPALTIPNGSSTYYALGPTDFATIYDTNPLLQAGDKGDGETIAILGVTNVHLQDVTDFRNFFGLGAGNTSVVIDGPDPGIVSGDEDESVLDLEWANAVAPNASAMLVSAQDTEATSGLNLAALHVIDNNLAGVMSLSYGICELGLGSTGNQFIHALWQQAAAQGITVVVSSGDDGAAGCDNMDVENLATSGLAVNGLASTPYNVAVGGTDFDDATTQTSYWNATNAATTLSSAKSYIPERTWNETCAATATVSNLSVCPAVPASGTPPQSLNLFAGSGGASSCSTLTSAGACQSGWPKPPWQGGFGVPADGVRDVPDVSLFAAADSSSRSFYVVCQADALPIGYPSCQPSSSGTYFLAVGGTSASAPSFAAMMAIAEQKADTRLGNVNYLLYSLAASSGASCSTASSGSTCLFHDVLKGTTSVPCQAGSPNCSVTSGIGTGVIVKSGTPAFNAQAGYDLATGLGSVDAGNLIPAIASALGKFTPTTTSLKLNGGTAAITVQHGSSINVGVSVSPTASTGDVSLFGKSGGIDFFSLNNGAANWASKLFPGGSYNVTAHYAGDGVHAASDSNAIPVTINPEPSSTFVNLVTFNAQGAPQSYTANNLTYGSPYILRMDVTNAAGTISPALGVNSSCSTAAASCPTGTLTLTANGAALDGGSFKLNGKGYAEDVGIQLPGGNYTLAASYPGDPSYAASAGSTAVAVAKAPTTLTFDIAANSTYQYGNSYQINGALGTTSSGVAPSAMLTFLDNGAATPSSFQGVYENGQGGGVNGYAAASYSGSYRPASQGAHTVSAQFPGDSNYAASTAASFSITVVKASTSVNSYGITPNISTPTLPVQLSANVFTGSTLAEPTGTITFYDNGSPISGAVTYSGGGNGMTAYLSGQMSTTFSQAGNHDISVAYSGDANYQPVTKDLGALTIDAKLPSNFSQLYATMSPALVSYPTNLIATVGSQVSYGLPNPTGTVTFYDNGQLLSGTVTYAPSGTAITATLPYMFTTSGSHSISASYSGDGNYANSSTAQNISLTVVDKLPTSIPSINYFSAILGQPGNFNLDVNSNYISNGPPMTGTVSFMDGNTSINPTVTYNSQRGYMTASASYTFTTPGTHTLTAQYSGDSHYEASTNTFTETVLGPLTVQFPQGWTKLHIGPAGGSDTVPLSVINTTTSAMAVTLTCTSDTTSATCSVNPASLNVPASATNGATFTYTVPALTASNPSIHEFASLTLVFSGVFGAFALPWSRKKRPLLLIVLIAGLVGGAASCGGGGSHSSTGGGGGGGGNLTPQSKTYNFTVTATSGANTSSQVITLTEQ